MFNEMELRMKLNKDDQNTGMFQSGGRKKNQKNIINNLIKNKEK